MNLGTRTYSKVLQMRSDTLRSLIETEDGFRWALRMFIVVTLIAGLGVFLGLGAVLSQPTLVEGIDALTAKTQAAEAGLQNALADLTSGNVLELPRNLLAGIQGQAAPLLGNLQQALSGLEAQVADLPGPAQAAVQSAEAAALARLQPLAESLGASDAQFTELLAKANLSAEQLDALLRRLRLAPDRLSERLSNAGVTLAQVDALLGKTRAAAVAAQPPIGVPASRIVRLAGQWLASPLNLAAAWIFFILALMLAARSLGGRASIREHLTAALLASAPLVLSFGVFAPNLIGQAGTSSAAPLLLFLRLLALIGVIWALALLVKTMATAHEFSNWRSLGALALTAVGLFFFLPLAALFAAGYLLVA